MGINIEDIQGYLNLIDLFKHRQCNEKGMKALIDACYSLVEQIPFQVCGVQSRGILRSRKNENDELFMRTEQLSYNKDTSRVSVGRFNLRNQPLFYGSLPTFNKDGSYINYGTQVALFEVCKELKTHQPLTLPSFFTVGCWVTSEKLMVVNLCHDQEHLNQNYSLQEPITEFQNNLTLLYSKDEIDFIQEIWKYFSVLSRTWNDGDNYHYNILAALLLAIQINYFSKHNIEVEGILYPSAMTDAKGMNIALEPHVVDKKLKLVFAQMYVLKHRDLLHGYQPITDRVKVENDKFRFTGQLVEEYILWMKVKKLLDNKEKASPELGQELTKHYRKYK